jgi:gas vesicle protein
MKNKELALLLTGVGVGAVAGLLFARLSGVELRKQITRRAGEAAAFLKNQSDAVVGRVTTAATDVEHGFTNAKQAMSRVAQTTKQHVGEAAKATVAVAHDMQDTSRAVISAAGR